MNSLHRQLTCVFTMALLLLLSGVSMDARSAASPQHGSTPTGSGQSGLHDAIRELLGALGQPDAQVEGVIAQAVGSKIYINIGSDAGVRVGDEFDIVSRTVVIKDPISGQVIGEEREVVGRLRVVSVQTKMATCSLLEGKAEQKNAEGEFNRVLPPLTPKKRRASIGAMDLERGAGVSESALTAAIRDLAPQSGWLELTTVARADFELQAQTRKAENGCTIALIVINRETAEVVDRAEALYRTGYSAAQLGFKSAVATKLVNTIPIGPAKAALQKIGTVEVVGDALFIPKAGARGEVAWVFPDGRIVIASRRDLSRREHHNQLKVAWTTVVKEIASVTADVKTDKAHEYFLDLAEYYTAAPQQFQSLYVQLPDAFQGWTLSWPAGGSSWAILLEGPASSGWAEVFLDEQRIKKASREEATSADLSGLQFGEHSFKSGRYRHRTWMLIDAYFAEPEGKIVLYDQANQPVSKRAVFSRPISSLSLPVPPGLARRGTSGEEGPAGAAGIDSVQLQRDLSMARNYFRANLHSSALDYCQRVIDAAPDSPEAAEARELIKQIKAAMGGGH